MTGLADRDGEDVVARTGECCQVSRLGEQDFVATQGLPTRFAYVFPEVPAKSVVPSIGR